MALKKVANGIEQANVSISLRVLESLLLSHVRSSDTSKKNEIIAERSMWRQCNKYLRIEKGPNRSSPIVVQISSGSVRETNKIWSKFASTSGPEKQQEKRWIREKNVIKSFQLSGWLSSVPATTHKKIRKIIIFNDIQQNSPMLRRLDFMVLQEMRAGRHQSLGFTIKNCANTINHRAEW